MPGNAKSTAHALLLDEAPPGELEWSDFDHITEARDHVEAAFKRFFALAPPSGLTCLAGLTPGDFSVVCRKAALLGRLEDAEALTEMRHAECDATPGRPRAIRFCG